ncbi:MAG: subfamily B ATP-binding cassette protein MsbA [Flavobacteriales bacterium]|jgi:subfamily B ATP-binding cassette protein MsbA
MNNPTPQLPLYRRLLRYTYSYKRLIFISLLGFILYAIMESALISMIKLFINALEGKPTEWVDEWGALLGLTPELASSLWFIPITMIVLAVFRGIGSYLGNFYISSLGLRVVNKLRTDVFEHLVYLPQSYHDKNNSSTLVSLIIYNIEQVTGSVTRAVKILFMDGILLVVFVVAMLAMNWKLTLAFFAITPLLAGIVFLAARYFRKVSRKIQFTIGQVTHVTKETLQSIRIVKSYNGEQFESNRFKRAANENLHYSTKFERVNALQTPIIHTIIATALATLFFLVLLLWPKGDAGGAVVYVTFAGMIGKHIRQLSSIISLVQRGLAAAETIFAAIDEEQEQCAGVSFDEKVRGAIEFKNLNFSYNDNTPALVNINLDIKPGETIALVGESGSGKTTLASLLLRFYKAGSGEITLDGKNLNAVNLRELRGNIALVSQMASLFSGSIKNNIVYATKQQSEQQSEQQPQQQSKERLYAAIDSAYASHFIEALDNGIDSEVGEEGDRLSGGQKQRISIARALYKDAPVLILDEATSALDNESEKQIQSALEILKKGKTTIIIAHRLSTIRNADKIVVMDKGRIVECGDHNTLIELDGYYAALHGSPSEQAD